MDIGRVGLWTFLLDEQPTSRVRDLVQEIEDMGWSTLWRPESTGRDVLVAASVMLEATSRLIVASGIAQIYARHPVTTAAAQKTLSEAHEDRFLLGLGVAHAASVEGIRKLNYRTPYSDMVAYLKAMAEAPYTAVEPATKPPTVLAALGPRMLKLSADAADGAHPYFTPPEHTAMARDILGQGPLLAPEQMVVIDSNLDRARSVARANMARYLRLPNYTNNLLRCGFTQTDIDDVTDRLVDGIVACGDLDVTVDRVQQHLDAGADHVCIQVLVADNDLDVTIDQWHRLAVAFNL
ncbi:MAG TPA: TIGR03620 family F420-dependent LLM class oxidoreductase [Actinobacteria bacterium]|nr:methylenetetrahydromethanopterin reductase [bacterium BMS3Bbin02]HDL42328.1 TIGR03620 family F420-dependent LLM class oxidoreductase [Actinomycetota bacterium]